TRIQTAFVKRVSEGEVASVMSAAGYPTAKVQKFTNKSIGGNGFQISTKTLRPDRLARIKSTLEAKFGLRNFSSTSIGPTFGKTVAHSAVIAIIASLLVISAYIALRFEWKYAVPVLIALMLFGGATLKDFAFALMVGIASGAYSSIFIASPVLTHWKEREAAYRSRRARIVREFREVPAYATTAAGAPEDVEPEPKRRRT